MSKIRRQDSRYKPPRKRFVGQPWYPCMMCEEPIGEEDFSALILNVPDDPHVFGWLCSKCNKDWDKTAA